jgi:hypothetical protein
MSGRVDLTAMYVTHNALRRDLEHIAKIIARPDDDPRRILTGVDGQTVAKMPAPLPEPVRAAYRDEWQPACIALDRWNGTA